MSLSFSIFLRENSSNVISISTPAIHNWDSKFLSASDRVTFFRSDIMSVFGTEPYNTVVFVD